MYNNSDYMNNNDDRDFFFEVEVDLAGGRAIVRKDADPNKLGGTKYEMNIRF